MEINAIRQSNSPIKGLANGNYESNKSKRSERDLLNSHINDLSSTDQNKLILESGNFGKKMSKDAIRDFNERQQEYDSRRKENVSR